MTALDDQLTLEPTTRNKTYDRKRFIHLIDVLFLLRTQLDMSRSLVSAYDRYDVHTDELL